LDVIFSGHTFGAIEKPRFLMKGRENGPDDIFGQYHLH
jgi:hypothetical protein